MIEGGRITAVGPDVQAPQGTEVVDATGRHVHPGMFDAVSRLGLTEIGAVDVTNDAREQGSFNPHLQAAAAIHPATEHIPVARANGITLTMAAPQGGTVAGQASLIGLDGWTGHQLIRPDNPAGCPWTRPGEHRDRGGAGRTLSFPKLANRPDLPVRTRYLPPGRAPCSSACRTHPTMVDRAYPEQTGPGI